MASMNSLLVSWNFDTLSGSSTDGQFIVDDTANNYAGSGTNFSVSDSSFLLKEDIKTNIKILPDVLEGSETIQTLEEDDLRIDELHKPSSVQLLLENSMYQIVSDDMLNMFSDITSLSFNFLEFSNKYKENYPNLDTIRHEYFSKVLEKPNLEKYLEYYKWLDSALGTLLDQLKPENSNNTNGLKNTIESHVLERNKYKHQLPLTIQTSRNFSSGVGVVTNKTLKKSSINQNISGSIDDFVNIQNISNHNFKNNYEVIQTAGKKLNNRGNKQNKTVIQTKFSTVDGLSDNFRDESGEYSVYNGINNKSLPQRALLNSQWASGSGIQGCTSSVECGSFRDNKFVQRNIPWTDENYSNTGSNDYQNIPDEEVLFRHHTNLLIDINRNTYENSSDIVEPPIQQNIPVKQDLKLNAAFENMILYSPFSSEIDLFSYRNLLKQNSILQQRISGGYHPINNNETLYNKILNLENDFTFNRFEKLEVIFPRTDLIGLAQIRTKSPSYDEEIGIFNTSSIASTNRNLSWLNNDRIDYWTDNSFNNNASKVRTFWRDSQEDRKRTNAKEANNGNNLISWRNEDGNLIFSVLGSIGSFNALGYPSRVQERTTRDTPFFLENVSVNTENNIHNLVYSMDANVDYYTSSIDGTIPTNFITCSNESYGELAPYSHFLNFTLANIYSASDEYDKIPKVQPKMFFTHNIFYEYFGTGDVPWRILNKSYQTGLDCRIKPWYDSYENFRANIKHKSQTHSIVPEYITSRFPEVINKQFVELYKTETVSYLDSNDPSRSANFNINTLEGSSFIPITKNIPYYLTINGGEKYDQIKKEDFKIDLKQFIDKKSNKIKFKLNAIKKILPYNGFYPQQKTSQLGTIFADTYLYDTGYIKEEERLTIEQNGDNSTGIDNSATTARTMAVIQPLFAPGILFNTIKAGMAMPWQTYVNPPTGAYSSISEDKYGMVNSLFETNMNGTYALGLVNRKLPFETILDPYKYYFSSLYYDAFFDSGALNFDLEDNQAGSENRFLFYLDPTHHARFMFPVTNFWVKKVKLTNLLRYMFKAKSRLYKSAVNNFLAESVNFFLQNSELTSIKSDINESISVTSGTLYSMDLVLSNPNNFSMFNKYSDDQNGLIPKQSLFGPPVINDESQNYEPRISSSLDPAAYLPYAPPYMYNSKTVLTLTYTADETKDITLKELIKNLDYNYSYNYSPDFVEFLQAEDSNPPQGDDRANSVKYRLNLKDLINYDLISGSAWVIQTKFETPLIKFDNCSLVETGSMLYEIPS